MSNAMAREEDLLLVVRARERGACGTKARALSATSSAVTAASVNFMVSVLLCTVLVAARSLVVCQRGSNSVIAESMVYGKDSEYSSSVQACDLVRLSLTRSGCSRSQRKLAEGASRKGSCGAALHAPLSFPFPLSQSIARGSRSSLRRFLIRVPDKTTSAFSSTS